MSFNDNSIRACKHCGYMGKPDTKFGNTGQGIAGTYCDDCKTQKQRDEMDAENKKLKEDSIFTTDPTTSAQQ